MWFDELRLWIRNYPRYAKPAARRRKMKRRLYVEALENRLCLSAFNAATTAALIADIAKANTNGASANTINLTGTSSYVLTAVNNTTNGPNGLPVIGSTVASTLTINGNGNIVENGSGSAMRFFEIAPGSGGSLVLKNIELQGGSALGSGTSAEGGAIFNNGTLNVDGGVQLFENGARGTGFTSGGAGNSAAGGGIYSTAGGTLKFNGNNLIEACGVSGGFAKPGSGAAGGNASGGGVFANTTTATSLSSTSGTVVENCQAGGGTGGARGTSDASGGVGGSALGGGLFVSGSSSTAKATLTGFTFDNDEAFGGNGGAGGFGRQGGNGGAGGNAGGGGIYASGGTVTDSDFINVIDCEALGGAGGNGGSGNFTGGGNGGNGGTAVGGGVDAFATTLTLTVSPTIENNQALGGGGGNGGAAIGSATTGGKGGNSGTGSGGGLYATSNVAVTVTLKNALVSNNTAQENRPGAGGNGFPGFGGAGGSYTGGFGGGIYLDQNASLVSDTINSNSASGGLTVPAFRLTRSLAGTGKSGGAGGNGATGAGGGLFVAGGTITVASSTFDFDHAIGGIGGSALNPKAGLPGDGGVGRGGGVDVESGTVTISKSQFESNAAVGASAQGTPSGGHAQGAAAAGGGLYAGGGTIHLKADFIQNNLAGGDYNPLTGSPNFGYGGGIYEVTGTTLTLDSSTSANLGNNSASASNNPSIENFASGGPIG